MVSHRRTALVPGPGRPSVGTTQSVLTKPSCDLTESELPGKTAVRCRQQSSVTWMPSIRWHAELTALPHLIGDPDWGCVSECVRAIAGTGEPRSWRPNPYSRRRAIALGSSQIPTRRGGEGSGNSAWGHLRLGGPCYRDFQARAGCLGQRLQRLGLPLKHPRVGTSAGHAVVEAGRV
jgi:hypothetical protein